MNCLRNNIALLIGALILMLAPVSIAASDKEEGKIDVQEIVLGHTGDSHEWHITTWGKNHISIPLPVIFMANDGSWHCFSSSRFHHAKDGKYNGFYIPSEGENNGKICELVNGKEQRVKFDISLTKNVVQLWIIVLLMLFIFIGCARWYRNKKADSDAPKGFVGLIEMFVMMVNDRRFGANIPWRCQPHRQPGSNTGAGTVHIPGHQHLWQQGILA